MQRPEPQRTEMNDEYKTLQPTQMPQPQQHSEDQRAGLIKTIWGCSVGMLGICIPLIGILHSNPIAPLLPFCIIVGATLSTLALSSNKGLSSSKSQLSASELAYQERIKQLEERLANIEMIGSFERGMGERQAFKSSEETQLPSLGREMPAAKQFQPSPSVPDWQ